MKKIFLTCFLFLFLKYIDAQEVDSLNTEDGVSLQLAKYRKSVLTNIIYALHLQIPEDRNQQIIATETITFSLNKKEVYPLQIDFKPDSVLIKNISVNGVATFANYKNEHLLIDANNLKEGENKIDISFIAGNAALNRREEYLYALFVPDRARTVFPCFDQPDLKAKFNLTLTVPKQWTAIANGKTIDSIFVNENKIFHFATSDILPTYLFSFVAGKFNTANSLFVTQNIPLLYRETDSTKIKYSLDSIFSTYKHAVSFCEDWTGIPFPFQKQGMIAVPDFQFGGMEHPGAILFQNATFFLPKEATLEQLNSRGNLIAHEVAHQWFGDMVTMKWFNDVWTKEVFANFMADKATGTAIDKQQYDLKFITSRYPSAYSVDRTPGANPIRQNLDNLQNAGMLYGPIIYMKAPIMMRQLEMLIGEDKFRTGVNQYLQKYKYSNATWDDLIGILDNYTEEDLIKWNNVWVNETGRPIVNFDVAYANGHVNKFQILQEPEYKNVNKIWKQSIQISFYYKNSLKTINTYLDAAKQNIAQVNGWPKPLCIVVNSSGSGYGVFPVGQNVINNFSLIKNPVTRASVYIALYENVLSGKELSPSALLKFLVKQLSIEKTELNLGLITGYISSLYWEFITNTDRKYHVKNIEADIWKSMQTQSINNNKKILFNCYQSIFTSRDAYQKLYNIWDNQIPPTGVSLTEDDYTSLALSLALRNSDNAYLLAQQLLRIKNPDRVTRFKILAQAASSDKSIRDDFFNALSLKKNRTNESAVGAALQYLFHPLRQETSLAYLPKSLDLLQEIQKTGDIFFPDNWLRATFRLYQSNDALHIVDKFLTDNENYNPVLKNKILQATDNLRRAVSLFEQTGVE